MHKVGFFRSIQLKFIIIYILLLILAVQLIGAFFTGQLSNNLEESFKDNVSSRMELLSYNLELVFNRERTETEEGISLESEVQDIVNELSTDELTNVIVVNNQSIIIGTNNNLLEINQRITRDIIQQVLFFDTTNEDDFINESGEYVYVRVDPIFDNENKVVGAIYMESSLEGVYNQLDEINKIFLQGALLAIAISAIIGVLVARSITKPIKEMRRQAQAMAKGDFTQKVKIYGKDEIGQLSEAFNDLNSRLRHSYATIEEERFKLSSVLSNMSDGVIATDQEGSITLINEAAGVLLGKNPDDLIGDDLLDVLQLDEKLVDISELRENSSMIIDFSDDNQPFLIRTNFSTVKDDQDAVNGFITVLNDVTEDEKVEQERRDFVSNVSHELRTPLTTMKSYLEALADGAWEDKEIAPKFLEVTQNETDRMIRMVNDLLQLSRMDAEEYSLHKEETDFIDYFHQIIDRFEMNLPETMTIKRELPNKKYQVWIDKDKMTQVLDNIISNAIKYSPEGGRIFFRAENKRHYLLISVQDEGMGIPYDRLEKIFDRFYRTDRARTRKLGGTGLGLAITKELVEAHHGRIWAKSREGHGTTIYFTLPLIKRKRRDIR
ncbi:cell wall metabolism sensor histidine kinase WalK [Oceanobacillus alkalisoli]|uniref:cell wall metabolism sensor histidine kinase WalK n=1 Tax=Oceanobacillus alkalisoli TaxID=2925113 RepID=UPI001EE3C09E|nr:cell wall metabolism sensor histidine kinase WalK [Oceanobacillus alkalisoli]MCG5103256.1 cell wall metabolism sensor histidine kinase WalK [Oceanobacillus alkalisoli]